MLFNNKLFNSIACLLSFTNLQLVIPGRTWILLYLGRIVYKCLWACLALYKETSRDINNFDSKAWNNVAEELCYEGVRQKFLQNQHLLDELLRTGNKTLVESSYDDVWGTGIPLSNRNCLVKEQWKSIGILGNILMGVRESARNDDITKPDDTEPTTAH